MKKKISIIVGILLIVISLFLAYKIKYNHFYEILLLGLFLLLLPFSKINIKDRKNLYLYFLFLILGIIIDLVLGRGIFNLWSYPNFNILENLILYIFIYPFGSFVMLLSYLSVFKNIKTEKAEGLKPIKILLFYLIIGLILAVISVFTAPNLSVMAFGVMFFAIIFFVEILNNKKGNITLSSLFFSNPKKISIILLLVTIINSLIHEHPNVYAQEWVYSSFLFKVIFFDMSVMVLAGWIALTLGAVVVYYAIFTEKKST